MTMKILRMFLILSVARNVAPRRRIKSSSSGESIENLLFYQDCKHSSPPPPTTPAPMKLRERVQQPTCPFPKMCCAMSCNNEPCVSEQLNNYGNQMHPNLEPVSRLQSPRQPFPPPQAVPRNRKRKFKPPTSLLGGGGRRDFGFTKENIKSLISHDDDIRKILKDLVRVTMQKVDLQEMINTRRKAMMESTTIKMTTDALENSEYEEVDL